MEGDTRRTVSNGDEARAGTRTFEEAERETSRRSRIVRVVREMIRERRQMRLGMCSADTFGASSDLVGAWLFVGRTSEESELR